MTLLERLSALDERVGFGQPRPTLGRRVFWVPLMMPVMFGSFALVGWGSDPRIYWLACAASAYAAGREIARTRHALLERGQDLPLRRLRALAPIVVPFAILGLSFTTTFRTSHDATVDVVRARALVQTVLDTATGADPADICDVARDEPACRDKVSSAPGPPVEPKIYKTLPLGDDETTHVAVYVVSASPPSICVLVVAKHRDELVIDDPAYWARDDC